MKINLATRIYIDHFKVKWGFNILFILLTVIVIWTIWGIFFKFDETRMLKNSMKSGQITADGRSVSENEYKQLFDRAAFINSFLETRNSRILTLLDRLEQVTPDSVMFTEISSEGKEGGYKISGYSSDFRKVRTLFENMNNGELFKDVFLVSQSKLKVSDAQQGVSFTISAKVR